MKKLLLLLLPLTCLGDVPPPPAATTAQVAAGVSQSTYVSPYTLLNSGVNVGLTAADVAAQIASSNLTTYVTSTNIANNVAGNVVTNQFKQAATIYVDPLGSPTNTGAIYSPFSLLSQAISNQVAGCTIRILAGTYIDQFPNQQLLYTNVSIDCDPGVVYVITNEIISSGAPMAIALSTSNTISGGNWFLFMTNYTVSLWNTWSLFGNAGSLSPAYFTIQHLAITTPAAGIRFNSAVLGVVNDCQLNVGYAGVVEVTGSGGGLIKVYNTTVYATNQLPAGASIASDYRTAFRVKGANSGQMILQNCAAVMSDQGLTSGDTNVFGVGQQNSGGTNQFIINGLTIDMSLCTNGADYDVGFLGTGTAGSNNLFNGVYDVSGNALTYSNTFSGSPKPWRSNPTPN